MEKVRGYLVLCSSIGLLNGPVHAVTNEELADMSVVELLQVEITLDDAAM